MAKSTSYIVLRGSTWQYHRRVPKRVIELGGAFENLFGGRAVYRRSLRATAYADALIRAAEVHGEFEARVAIALGKSPQLPTTRLRPVTQELCRKIAALQAEGVTAPFRRAMAHRETHLADGQEELDRLIAELELDAEDITNILIDHRQPTHPRLDVAAIAAGVIEGEGLDAPVGSGARALIQAAVRDGLLEGYRSVGEIYQGRQSIFTMPQRIVSSGVMLSKAVEAYVVRIEARRTKIEVRGALRDFVRCVADLPLDELKPEHFRKFCSDLAANTIGGKTVGSVMRPMSVGSIKKKLGLLRAAINVAIEHGHFAGPNPAAGIDASKFALKQQARSMPAKRRFDLEELNRIFAYPWFTGCESANRIHAPGQHRLTGMHFWVPVLALLTGCRAGELGGLKLDEVRLDDQFPHILIRDNEYRRTKGGYQRSVPVLDQLLEIGFRSYVERIGDEGHSRLFPDWTAPSGRAETDDPAWSNGSLIRAFNTTLIPKALDGLLLPQARREVTFHSFRGAFKALLGQPRWAIPLNHINEVIGHAKSELDRRYIGVIPLDETYPAIRGCRFEGLTLPTAP